MSGAVLVDNIPADKPGTPVNRDAEIRLKKQPKNFVGRGGEKLEGALNHFELDPAGKVYIDLGSSTGGFTDCLLRRGAEKVYAVDVGTNQLHYSLRQNPRVVSMEQTHARDLSPGMFDQLPEGAVVDVSFISLRKVLPFLMPVLQRGAKVLALVKPQFELEKEMVERGGVVRDEQKQKMAIEAVKKYCIESNLVFFGVVPSVITGAKKGNQEYFVLVGTGD